MYFTLIDSGTSHILEMISLHFTVLMLTLQSFSCRSSEQVAGLSDVLNFSFRLDVELETQYFQFYKLISK